MAGKATPDSIASFYAANTYNLHHDSEPSRRIGKPPFCQLKPDHESWTFSIDQRDA
jgi:hypothetical protein